jgi:hypothetical protein
MIPFSPTLDDCIRAVYDRFRLYGITYKELSFEDIGQIVGLIYGAINLKLATLHPQFYVRQQVVAKSGGKLNDDMVVVLNVRRKEDGVILRYCTPQEWVQCNTQVNAGAGIIGAHSYEPAYTVWGGYYAGPAGSFVGPPTDTTTGVTLTPGTYHGGVYIYYTPPDDEVVVEMVALPSLPQQGPLFESQLLKVMPSLFDTLVMGVTYLSLLMIETMWTQEIQQLASQAATVWGNFVGSVDTLSMLPFLSPLQNEPTDADSKPVPKSDQAAAPAPPRSD